MGAERQAEIRAEREREGVKEGEAEERKRKSLPSSISLIYLTKGLVVVSKE